MTTSTGNNWYINISNVHSLPKRILGKTGYKVSIFSLGGQGSLEKQGNKDNNISIIQRAYELGVNYFDTSPIYGPSEDYYGSALKGIRRNVFLATKTDKRDRDGALRDLDNSLKRLNTDYIDLWQIHHLENEEEVDRVSSKNGALRALVEMQDEGVVRHLGYTGHEDPNVLINMGKRYDFDAALCPINAGDVHMNPSFIKDFLPFAKQKDMGVIGMKVFSQGFAFHPNGITTSWDPLFYSLSQDISNVIVGCDSVSQLEENVALTNSFYNLSKNIMTKIENKTSDYIERINFFRKEFGGYDSREKLESLCVVEN